MLTLISEQFTHYCLRDTVTAISLDAEGVDSHEYEYIEKYSKTVVETNLTDTENDVVITPCPAYATSTVKIEENNTDAEYETINQF